MKSLLIATVLLFASSVFAAPEKQNVSNEEMQNELDTLDETIVLDEEDEKFLNAGKKQTQTMELEKSKVVWGKVIEPAKKAKAPVQKPTTQQ